MRKLLPILLLFFTISTNAMTVDKEIAALMIARDYQLDVISITGNSSTEAGLLEQISQNIRKRTAFLKAREEDGETRYLLVNKSEYYLEVIEHDAVVLRDKIIIGKPGRATPEFSNTIKYIVVNPYWNVPANLARKDVIPKLNRIRDKFGIERMYTSIDEGGYRFFSGDTELNPNSIDFSQYDRSSEIPFRIRQDPGDQNSLGLIKFVFPNQYNVYIHDTPHRGLFDREYRRYSSGCIRLQNPANLAAYLLGEPKRDILNMIDNPENRAKWLKIPDPLPIHIVDWNITVTEDGVILD